MTLKFNIALSALGTTPRGFGELQYTEAGNPFAGMLLRDLAVKADSMMTFWAQYRTTPAVYGQLDTALRHINAAFSGAIDTVKFSDTLKLTGTQRLVDVGILTATSVTPAVLVEQTAKGAMDESLVPVQAALYQNYPNPFNPTTQIRFDLPVNMQVSITVFNLLGQEVQHLANNEPMEAGVHEVTFDGSNMASGVYFYRIMANGTEDQGVVTNYQTVKKMLLVK